MKGKIIAKLMDMRDDEHPAISNKVAHALNVLQYDNAPMPAGWFRSRTGTNKIPYLL
jgi:hypothetical protein